MGNDDIGLTSAVMSSTDFFGTRPRARVPRVRSGIVPAPGRRGRRWARRRRSSCGSWRRGCRSRRAPPRPTGRRPPGGPAMRAIGCAHPVPRARRRRARSETGEVAFRRARPDATRSAASATEPSATTKGAWPSWLVLGTRGIRPSAPVPWRINARTLSLRSGLTRHPPATLGMLGRRSCRASRRRPSA
jgi:hypothetical protein